MFIHTNNVVKVLISITLMFLFSIASFSQDAMSDNNYWWPNRLNLEPLRMNNPTSNPMGENFNYAEAFSIIDLDALKADLEQVMTTSQDWWPADYGHYGPFFIRMAWHSSGTYRTFDGRGGSDGGYQRFAPLNSWPDNANLDKAQRLLWPIKAKYGASISWADLMVLAGTVAMESMGFETFGFAGGRTDAWEPDDVYWGPEGEWLADDRHAGDRQLVRPLGATQMGLIYVNPVGPNGNPDPLAAANDIRVTFGRMAMNDEETIALIAGGHTFGKAHGAANPSECIGVEPEGGSIEQQGLGWKNSCGTGNGSDTVTSGLEGAWTINPVAWTHNYLQNLYTFDWVQSQSPAGAIQWVPSDESASSLVPDAHNANIRHAPIMFTTDLALKEDPAYREITLRWLENPQEFADAFARAWFKLTHRDLGPRSRYLGSLVPEETLIWQDPVPDVNHTLVTNNDVRTIKRAVLASGLSTPELVRLAWASASTYRVTDKRGGSNGARIRLAPQNSWEVNQPDELNRVIGVLENVQQDFNDSTSRRKQVSLADVIVIAGNAAIERAASEAGHDVTIPFSPGRMDATQEMTDVAAFSVLEPTSDPFRNYHADKNPLAPVSAMIEKAALLDLSIPEMTVLLGGMRALNANFGNSAHGVFTNEPGVLSNDYFVNLLDMSTVWSPSSSEEGIYIGTARESGAIMWTATPVDLIFGSNTELRAVVEVYATSDGESRFIRDFVSAWNKVMNADRFEL
jgi:catalase-peroxidase